MCAPGVGSTTSSWAGGGFVVSGPASVVLLGPTSLAIRTGDLRSMRKSGPLNRLLSFSLARLRSSRHCTPAFWVG